MNQRQIILVDCDVCVLYSDCYLLFLQNSIEHNICQFCDQSVGMKKSQQVMA